MKKIMFFKRLAVYALTGIMCISLLCGCENTNNTKTLADDETKPYEINWYLYGTTVTDAETVEAKVNEYLKDKINATLNINVMESAQYQQKVNAMIASGEYFDLCFCSASVLSYRENSGAGAFFPIGDYMQEYMPKTFELLGNEEKEAAKVNGTMYALPVIKENSQQFGWIYRKDIADKYGIDMSQYKNYEQLENVLDKIKENEPSMQTPVNWNAASSPVGFMLSRYAVFSSGAGVYFDGTYPVDTVKNLIETPEYLEACQTAHRYYQKGYISKDILTDNNAEQKMKNGEIFCYMTGLKPGKAKEVYSESEYDIQQVGITDIIQNALPGTGAMQAIANSSKNPVRVMKFLELLNTDEYLYNLIVFGVEGIHYNKLEEKVIKPIENSGYSLSNIQWMFGNVYQSYTKEGEDKDKYVKLKEFDDKAVRNVFNTFAVDTEPIDIQIQSVKSVSAQYVNQVALGSIEPQAKVKEYIAALKEAGMDEIIEEEQRQYTEFLKANGQ